MVGDDQRRGPSARGQSDQRRDGVGPGVRGLRGRQRQRVIRVDPGRSQPQPVPGHPLPPRLYRRGAGDDRDPPVPEPEQVLSGQAAAGDVVAEHAVPGGVGRPAGEVHRRHPQRPQFLAGRAVGADDDHAGRGVLGQGPQRRPLGRGVSRGHGQHELVAVPGQLPLDDLRDRVEARVDKVGHHQADELRTGRPQYPRAGVRPVAERLGGRPDLRRGGRAHPL
jgi:hypothetical protein